MIVYAQDGGKVQPYTVDRATGELKKKGAGVQACPKDAYNFKVDAAQKFLFVACREVGAGIAVLPIDSKSGDLGAAKTANGDGLPTAIAITAAGDYAITANYEGHATLFKVSGGTPSRQGKYDTGPAAHGATFDGLGKFAYVGNRDAKNVSQFSLSSAGLAKLNPGAVTLSGNLGDGQGPRYLTASKDGKFVYVAAERPPSIYGFKVGADGALSKINDGVSAVQGPIGSLNLKDVVLGLSGDHLYTSVCEDDTIATFTVDKTTGAVARKGANLDAEGSCPTQLALDPAGQFLFVINNSQNDTKMYKDVPSIGVFKVGADGTLTSAKKALTIPKNSEALAAVNLAP